MSAKMGIRLPVWLYDQYVKPPEIQNRGVSVFKKGFRSIYAKTLKTTNLFKVYYFMVALN